MLVKINSRPPGAFLSDTNGRKIICIFMAVGIPVAITIINIMLESGEEVRDTFL